MDEVSEVKLFLAMIDLLPYQQTLTSLILLIDLIFYKNKTFKIKKKQ